MANTKAREKPGRFFAEVPVCSWKQLVDQRDQLSQLQDRNSDKKGKYPTWIFRGAKKEDNKLGLTCHLEEAFQQFEIDRRHFNRLEVERVLIREFRRRAHHYTDNLPNADDTLEWLALMRHYNAPTRLLDWTYSFYVALYFSINRWDCKKSKPVIWAMNASWLSKKVEKIILKLPGVTDRLPVGESLQQMRDWDTYKANVVVRSLLEHSLSFLYNVTPFRLNERVIAQQGTFLCIGDTSKTFEENLKGSLDVEQGKSLTVKLRNECRKNIKRYVLKINSEKKRREERNNILRQLNRMSINHAALFPDLEGFAKSLKRHLAYPDEKFGLRHK